MLFAFLALSLGVTGGRGVDVGEGSAEIVRQELHKLGPMSKGQRNVLIAFGVTVLLWTTPGLLAIVGLALAYA